MKRNSPRPSYTCKITTQADWQAYRRWEALQRIASPQVAPDHHPKPKRRTTAPGSGKKQHSTAK